MCLYENYAKCLVVKNLTTTQFLKRIITTIAEPIYQIDGRDLIAAIQTQLLNHKFCISKRIGTQYIKSKDYIRYIERSNIKIHRRGYKKNEVILHISYKGLRELTHLCKSFRRLMDHAQAIINALAIYLLRQ